MNENLITAFDACVTALENGVPLEECLKQYPEFVQELRPMLHISTQTRMTLQSIQAPVRSQQESRSRFLAQAARLSKEAHAVSTPANLLNWAQSLFRGAFSRALLTAAVFVLVIILAGAGAVRASAHSLPGTPLYGLKRTIEQTQIVLSPNAESRARLEEKFSEQRTLETHQVVERGWNVSLEFGGQLEAMNAETWMVEGVAVIVPSGTQIEGSPQIGLYVRVQGTSLSNGSVQARQIWVDGERFEGLLEDIQSDEWQIGGRSVLISHDTQIEDHPAVGDLVEVNIMILPSGSSVAERIRLVNRGGGSDDPEQPSNTPPAASEDHSNNSSGNNQKTPEPTHTASPNGGSPSQTPDLLKSGSGNTPQPTKTLEPTRTPNSGGSNGSGGSTSTPVANQEIRVDGTVQSITGSTWNVAGQTIHVDGNTFIENDPQPGDLVEVRAVLQSNGTLLALRIKKIS